VSPVVPDVTAVVTQVSVVGTQASPVVPNVTLLLASSLVISIAEIVPHSAAVLADVAAVGPNVLPVLSPVNSVLAQVLSGRALAQRKSRSQYSKHQQTNDSSSHIASLVSGPDWPL
jgi:hypothetical protein